MPDEWWNEDQQNLRDATSLGQADTGPRTAAFEGYACSRRCGDGSGDRRRNQLLNVHESSRLHPEGGKRVPRRTGPGRAAGRAARPRAGNNGASRVSPRLSLKPPPLTVKQPGRVARPAIPSQSLQPLRLLHPAASVSSPWSGTSGRSSQPVRSVLDGPGARPAQQRGQYARTEGRRTPAARRPARPPMAARQGKP